MRELEFFLQNPLWILAVYLLIINLILFFTMAFDKLQARRHGRRVPEASLFLLALLGGSLGGICGMFFFRHKTRHLSFRLGFPIILILELALALWLILR